MLKIHVQNEAVRRNLHLFKQIVHRSKKAENERYKTFSGFVHRQSGAMVFYYGKDLSDREWKAIDISIDLDHHAVFAYEKGKNEKIFECGDLTPLAYRVMSETLHILDKLSHEAFDLKELSYFELDPSIEATESHDLIHEAWHQVDRKETEKLLANQAIGAYLFRKDEYAAILEQELTTAHKTPIRCVTLSYVDAKRVVRDCTLVKFCTDWQIYQDPRLSALAYSSIKSLIEAFEPQLGKPLLHATLVKS
jgi:hypothetical protein